MTVVQLAVTARQVKARRVVQKDALAHAKNALGVHRHTNVHGHFHAVGPVFKLAAHARALPGVPIGNVRKIGVAVGRDEKAVGIQLVHFAAGLAGQANALPFHFAFGKTGGAFVEHAVEKIRAEGLVDAHAVLLLPAEAVKAEALAKGGVDLVRAHARNVLGRKKILQIRRHFHLTALKIVVERIARKCTVGADQHHGNAKMLDEFAKAVGQGRGRAVKGIARFGIHQHRAFLRFDRVGDVADQPHLADEFFGGNAADLPHEPPLAHKAVGGGHDVEGAGKEHARRDLQIHKAGVVHQDQAGLALAQLLHADPLAAKAHRQKVGQRHELKQYAKEEVYTLGLLMLFGGDRRDVVIGHRNGLDLHTSDKAPFLSL